MESRTKLSGQWEALLKIVRLYRESDDHSKAGIMQSDDIAMIFSAQSPYAKVFPRVEAYLNLIHVKECPVL